MYNINSRYSLVLHLAVLVGICGLLFFSQLPRFPFFNKGEPREALVVKEIYLHGQWLFPLKRGEVVPSKPPLFHWSGALASLASGHVTEATVRFPSAFFATMGVLLLYLLGWKLFDPHVAFFGGIILATSVGYQNQAINARVDMTLTFFMILILVIFYLLYQGLLAGAFWTYGFYIILGFSVLAKGPVSLILAGLIAGAFIAIRKRWEALSRLRFHKGIVLTLLIAVSWYGIALMRGGEDFFLRQIIHENIARFFVHGAGGAGHQKPFYYYFPYLFLEGLPWTLFLPFVLWEWFASKAFTDERSLFLMLWVGIVFLFFSLSSGKRAVYLLPLYPPLSLLTGFWLSQPAEDKRIRIIGLKCVGWICLVMGLICFVSFLGIAIRKGILGYLTSFGGMLGTKDLANLTIVNTALSQAGGLFLFFLGFSVILWTSSGYHFIRIKPKTATVWLGCISFLMGLFVQGMVIPALAKARSYKFFVTKVHRQLGENTPLSIYGAGWDATSVEFYSNDRVPVIRGDRLSLLKRLRESGEYCIMSEREWKKLGVSGMLALPPLLRSKATGPGGKDPIILVRDVYAGER
ncbi:MAG: ArnT family glycosyltransferase [Candidatus Binatia bacterium]